MQYQTLRSVSDNHVFVLCHDGGFYEIPQAIRKQGPWQGMQRGEIDEPSPSTAWRSLKTAMLSCSASTRCSTL
jgi:hypothetical protein